MKIWWGFCYILPFSHLLYPILCINGKLSPKKDVENLWENLVGFAQKKTVAPNLSRGNNRPQILCFGTEHEEEHQGAGEETSQMSPVVHTHIQKAHGKGCECQQDHGGVVHTRITGTFFPGEDEHGAQKPEYGAGCADGGVMPQKNAAKTAADAGNEIQNPITDFAQQQFRPTAEVKEINAVGGKVHDAAVAEHGGDEAVILPLS